MQLNKDRILFLVAVILFVLFLIVMWPRSSTGVQVHDNKAIVPAGLITGEELTSLQNVEVANRRVLFS